MTINCAANFYQASCPEILYRIRHDHISPAPFVRALLQSRCKSLVQHGSIIARRPCMQHGETFGSAGVGVHTLASLPNSALREPTIAPTELRRINALYTVIWRYTSCIFAFIPILLDIHEKQ